jgi:ribosome-associated translation inhibitor RaiA
MQILINSEKKVSLDESLIDHSTRIVSDQLSRFTQQITRVEVHFTDENSHKEGQNDKRCLVEARLEGLPPIAATNHANSFDTALKGALDKLKTAMDSRIGKLRNY